MLVPTIKTAFPHSNCVCCDTIIQLCRKAVCVVCPSLYWKITIKGAWQVGPPTLALTSCIKRKSAKIPIVLTLPACQQPKIIPFGRFSWPCPCWQTSGMILHWLQNIQMWPSVPIPFQPSVPLLHLKAATNSKQQPEIKALSQFPLLETYFLCFQS